MGGYFWGSLETKFMLLSYDFSKNLVVQKVL